MSTATTTYRSVSVINPSLYDVIKVHVAHFLDIVTLVKLTTTCRTFHSLLSSIVASKRTALRVPRVHRTPPTLISDFMSLQRKDYTNITFRARLVFVEPIMTSITSGYPFRVIVSDRTQSMRGLFWSWDQETFDFISKNIQKNFEFSGTYLRIVKEERFAREHFLQFSLDKLDRSYNGYTGRFFVLPDSSEEMRFLTTVVPMSRTTTTEAPTTHPRKKFKEN